jgi:hypothetical protein
VANSETNNATVLNKILSLKHLFLKKRRNSRFWFWQHVNLVVRIERMKKGSKIKRLRIWRIWINWRLAKRLHLEEQRLDLNKFFFRNKKGYRQQLDFRSVRSTNNENLCWKACPFCRTFHRAELWSYRKFQWENF